MMKPHEIQVMAKQVTQYGKALCLLYKDARYDMSALDAMFGPKNWQKTYRLVGDSLFCTVSVWDSEKNCWVAREDVGTETQVAEEKGQASDAFKRACYNWGIGRELYTAPDIWIPLDKEEIGSYEAKGKQVYTCKQSFRSGVLRQPISGGLQATHQVGIFPVHEEIRVEQSASRNHRAPA